MSADAKAWQDDQSWWHGIHDGDYADGDTTHEALFLTELLTQIETCSRYQYAWSIRRYKDGRSGLVGYCYGGRQL